MYNGTKYLGARVKEMVTNISGGPRMNRPDICECGGEMEPFVSNRSDFDVWWQCTGECGFAWPVTDVTELIKDFCAKHGVDVHGQERMLVAELGEFYEANLKDDGQEEEAADVLFVLLSILHLEEIEAWDTFVRVCVENAQKNVEKEGDKVTKAQ